MSKKTKKTGKARKAGTRGRKTAPATPGQGKTPSETSSPAAPPAEPVKVNVAAAKGRPMLTWVGKRPLAHVTAFPAQFVERHTAVNIVDPDLYDEERHDERMSFFGELRSECNEECWEDAPFVGMRAPEVGGLLFHGDNKDVLAFLLANGYRGEVDLIYIDPPFDSAADYLRRVTLRGPKATATLSGETYTLGEQLQYSDIWANDSYLQYLYERLLLLKELLSGSGTIYVHTDSHRTHHIRNLMDEVFGADNFKNDIVWQRFNFRADGAKYGTVHDTILLYTKSDDYHFEKPFVTFKPSYIRTHFRPDESGRLFRLDNLTAPAHGKQGKSLRFGDKMIAPPPGTMWRHDQAGIDDLWAKNLIFIPEDGVPQVKRYLDEIEGQAVHSIWTDVTVINSQSHERTDYPTQKPELLLDRIVCASSRPGDLVLDAFCGSGTTAAVAQKNGRRWIGCDINKGAIQTTVKRLRGIIAQQIETARKAAAKARQGKLIETAEEGETPPPKPCGFGFTVWRVNDYDLQIQHNEAVNLACEHIGIERTRSDSFFEGTLGKRLVKIVPFAHPLTPLDLEELKRELDSRPDEDRGIVVVCLGMELAAKGWIAEWNRLRKGRGAVNKIEVIELRTDPKYGKVIRHEPAAARVKIARVRRGDEARIAVEIQDFISPTIVERLRQQAGILSPKIDDFRAMIDCVYIDPAYNGSVLNVALADVPERKADLVSGKYELPAPAEETTVAVKVVDMLGEEVLVTKAL